MISYLIRRIERLNSGIYYRHEGTKIRKYRLGIQFWHGLNIFWRTNTRLYIFGWGGHKR